MSKPGKDSLEVVNFMELFARLKDWSDDDPEGLFDFAESDESIKELCSALAMVAHSLRMNERRARILFAAPVDPKFLLIWRDFEDRYEIAVSNVWFADILKSIIGNDTPSIPDTSRRADFAWDSANDEASEQAGGIEDAIAFARDNIEQTHRHDSFPEGFVDEIEEGLAAWDRLRGETGFDLHGVFRRRALVPFVLVPRSIAAKHGPGEKLSLLQSLQEAQHAFVFGATYAAIALMRSIMEAVLRDHYGAEGGDLSQRINDVRRVLPRGANEAALHRLRKMANAILHLDSETDQGLRKMSDVDLERQIVSLLFVLRALIEGAPDMARPSKRLHL